MSIARKEIESILKCGNNLINNDYWYFLDKIAKEKDQDWKNEKTAWIFEDGSAIIISPDSFEFDDNYGLSVDNEQLK